MPTVPTIQRPIQGLSAPCNILSKKEPVRAASLAEKEVPVPTIRKVSTTLLLQPGLERQVDAGLGALPRVLPGQVAVRQDHVLHSIGDVPEHFRPEENYVTRSEIIPNIWETESNVDIPGQCSDNCSRRR